MREGEETKVPIGEERQSIGGEAKKPLTMKGIKHEEENMKDYHVSPVLEKKKKARQMSWRQMADAGDLKGREFQPVEGSLPMAVQMRQVVYVHQQVHLLQKEAHPGRYFGPSTKASISARFGREWASLVLPLAEVQRHRRRERRKLWNVVCPMGAQCRLDPVVYVRCQGEEEKKENRHRHFCCAWKREEEERSMSPRCQRDAVPRQRCVPSLYQVTTRQALDQGRLAMRVRSQWERLQVKNQEEVKETSHAAESSDQPRTGGEKKT